ncbi:glycoside hydrolase family 3 protein [Paenarthrobacter sp. Z7-10]|nr:glycoside hydrolase family 3 protein [Paenarthrobacter sp. Z7-10]
MAADGGIARGRLSVAATAGAVSVLLVLTGCTSATGNGPAGSPSAAGAPAGGAPASAVPSSGPSSSGPATAQPQPSASASASATGVPPSPVVTPAASKAARTLARMTLAQKVGQLLMIGAPVEGIDANTPIDISTYHVGNVYLKGRTYAGSVAAAAVVAQLKAQVNAVSTAGVRQFVATDQEGGFVQVLNGPGFSAIPIALDQGGLDPAILRSNAKTWGSQLAGAGINVNLAPILDTVPSDAVATGNAPIGHYFREYGFTPESVASHGIAFLKGMADAGVAAVPKHFPGLGRVSANTDISTGVTDNQTIRNDPYIAPFLAAVTAGSRWMMVSSALYPAIDAHHIAPFSSVVLKDMLRKDLGFTGIIISDDLCSAVQLSPYAVEKRGADFIAAGGTMALCADAAMVPALHKGITRRAESDSTFAAAVDAAALKVLEVKAERHLLGR